MSMYKISNSSCLCVVLDDYFNHGVDCCDEYTD